jgi:hypothetical protein
MWPRARKVTPPPPIPPRPKKKMLPRHHGMRRRPPAASSEARFRSNDFQAILAVRLRFNVAPRLHSDFIPPPPRFVSFSTKPRASPLPYHTAPSRVTFTSTFTNKGRKQKQTPNLHTYHVTLSVSECSSLALSFRPRLPSRLFPFLQFQIYHLLIPASAHLRHPYH